MQTFRILDPFNIQGVLKRVDQSNTPLNPLYFGVFLMFCACLTIQYGRFFILVLQGHIIEKKSRKTSSSKKVRFQGSLKLAHFLLIEIWGLPTLSSIILGIVPSI